MSTDLHDRRTSAIPEPHEPEEKKHSGSLSPAQLVGGALAAMTAAFLGSRLSVAGTVVGAALASVVAAVGSSVYTSSLQRTHERVSQVWKGRGRTESRAGASAPTRAPDDVPALGTVGRRRPRVSWKAVLAGSVATFAVAALALTGIELATGQALSGGQGTTVSEVADRGGSGSTVVKPTAGSTPSPSSTSTESAQPSATPTASPTPEPTPSESTVPTPTPSAAPTATATQTPPATTPG